MREVARDNQFQAGAEPGPYEDDEPVDRLMANTGPSETELVIVALLMRLYDINLALLRVENKELADRVFETHEQGGNFNPPVFIPTFSEEDTEEATGE